jgi:hypothetical protein
MSAAPAFEGLGDLPGGRFDSRATAVAAGGLAVVGESRGRGDLRDAFLWTPAGGMRSLHDVLAAAGVSDDGLVAAGTGTNPQRHVEAWRAVLPAAASWRRTRGVLGAY